MKRNCIVLYALACSLLLTAGASVCRAADDPIVVRIYIVKGSLWASSDAQALIREEVVEARRIWFANVGVKLSIKPTYTVIEGDPGELSQADIAGYAQALQAAKRNIVVVFTDKSIGISRAWTQESLVDANTPVIIMGKPVKDKPGTFRDLAHELGHVLLRDPSHSTGGSDLMNITWAPDNGDVIRSAQKEKALKYPD